jgi:hypothetical protein
VRPAFPGVKLSKKGKMIYPEKINDNRYGAVKDGSKKKLSGKFLKCPQFKLPYGLIPIMEDPLMNLRLDGR